MHPAQGVTLAESEAAGGIVHAGGDLGKAGLDGLKCDGEEAHQVGVDQGGDSAGEEKAGIEAKPGLPLAGEPVVEPGCLLYTSRCV